MASTVIPRDSLVGMVAGPLVWVVQFLACYIVTALACAFGWSTAEAGGWDAVSTILVAVSGVALAAVAGLTVLAYGRWSRAMANGEADDPRRDRHRFMARTGLMLCVLSGIAVVFTAVPLLILSPCQ